MAIFRNLCVCLSADRPACAFRTQTGQILDLAKIYHFRTAY